MKIKVVWIFNIYGPGRHPNDGRVVSNFIMQALRNESITVFRKGNQTRSFCYVDDMIEGLIGLAKQKLGWEPKVPLVEGLTKTVDYFKGVSE